MNDNNNNDFIMDHKEAVELSLKITNLFENKHAIVAMMALGISTAATHASNYTGNNFAEALDDWYSVVRNKAIGAYKETQIGR